MVLLLMKVNDQSKYGTLFKGFVSQFSLGYDQYPKTIATATYILSNHRLYPKIYENKRDKHYCENTHNDTEKYKNSATIFAHKYAT